MTDLKGGFIQLCSRNKDGSYSTKAKRLSSLINMGAELAQAGYRFRDPKSLKPKHVEALVSGWKDRGLSTGTIKNRMSHLRWWAEKVGKQNVVHRNNSDYGIENRQYVTSISKGRELSDRQLDQVQCDHVKASLMLQREFGLRREEAIKFDSKYAVRGDHIQLKGTWCKGGKERTIPIQTNSQRSALRYVDRVSANGCLIPRYKNYIRQLKTYERETSRAKLSKMHGLRHEFAQQQYKRLTGWHCSAKGGPMRKELTPAQKVIDTRTRLTISKMLGHERIAVTSVYLGR